MTVMVIRCYGHMVSIREGGEQNGICRVDGITKGGVGKSTLARIMAREAAINDLSVKIGDLDVRQSTSTRWAERRMANGIEPPIRVETFRNVEEALKEADSFDVFVLDGAPQASEETFVGAKACDLVVIPTGESHEDREPAVDLALELHEQGIPAEKIVFALCRVGDSEAQIAEARRYLGKTPFDVLDGEMPERSSFKTTLKTGKAPTETSFKSLKGRTEVLAQSMIDALTREQHKEEVA